MRFIAPLASISAVSAFVISKDVPAILLADKAQQVDAINPGTQKFITITVLRYLHASQAGCSICSDLPYKPALGCNFSTLLAVALASLFLSPNCPALKMNGSTSSYSEFWLYGYGSLIWKPPPHFDTRIPGYVTGYVRRFWQASQDHRGTPENPGRVVTLIERSYWEQLTDHHDTAPERVWGVAYRIIPEKVAEVKEYLDIREINGYSIHYAPFQPADGSAPIRTLVYIGTPDNDQFVGPQDPQALAEHIFRSEGPSGFNKDYLLNLEIALNDLAPDSGDDHISDLARRVRDLESRTQNSSKVLKPSIASHDFKQETSTEEAEEIEKGTA